MRKLEYNNKVLSDAERMDFSKLADGLIKDHSECIDGMYQIASELSTSDNNEFKSIMNTIITINIFLDYSFGDCVVLSKLFINAKNIYEKRFLRGKLKVQLNESFKTLYGFNTNAYQKSYCAKLQEIIPNFPGYANEFNQIISDLEEISKQDSWWKDIRDAEVHIDIDKLHELRSEEINESKVAMESMQLIDFFNRIRKLVANINQTYINYMWQHVRF